MPSKAPSQETRREVRFYVGILVSFLAAGAAIAAGILAWRLIGDKVQSAWNAIPVEMRVTLQLSLLFGGIALAIVASIRAWRDWRGRVRAKARARETPPIVEFSAGSVTAATLTDGEAFDEQVRRGLNENRRKYVVRPKDAMARPRREWGTPVLFAEPTRAGDTRLAPVMALATAERRKHRRNLQTLTAGTGQLSGLRVVLGVGKGYTSLTRAHALRDDLAVTQAKFRMNCIVTDRPSSVEAAPEPHEHASLTPELGEAADVEVPR